MRTVKNEVTGVNEVHFDAKVLSIGETVLENSNGKPYVVGTVEFTIKGNTQRASALMYTNQLSAANVEIGTVCNCRALPPREGEKTSLLILDPVMAAQKADASIFGFATTEATIPA
jgi:hypothetical protein